MASEADARMVRAQEAALVFDRFDDDTAFAIGKAIRDEAAAKGRAIAIDIRLWSRPLFYASMAGTTAENADWLRRKGNTVRRYGCSTYRHVADGQSQNYQFPAWRNLDPTEYVAAGGGFPITVKGAGPIGAICVSGLTDRDDHNVIVAALCAHLGKDPGPLTLAPPSEG